MNQHLTHVTAVLDASGSMGRNNKRSGVIEGFNEFFREQTDVVGQMTVSLYEFSTSSVYKQADSILSEEKNRPDVRRKFQGRLLSENRPELTRENYVTGGRTPLYDALVQAIDETGERLATLEEKNRPANVVVLTLTDGKENASKANTDHVRDRIEHQTSVYDWEFLFMGANQDAILEASKISIDSSRSINTDNSGEGMKEVMTATTETVSAYRAGHVESPGYDDYRPYEENSNQ